VTIYVIARNGGYEGHSPPLLCCADREVALKALAFMKGTTNESLELFEVPEWPDPPNCWYDSKPIAGDAT
jgi:hypothetical protein